MYSKFKSNLMAVAIISSLAGSIGNAYATDAYNSATNDQGKKAKTLQKIQVSANANHEHVVSAGALGSQSDLNTPFSVTTITAAQLDESQAYTLSQAFAEDASVSRSGSDYNGWSSRMIVRGLPLSFTDSTKLDGIPFALFGVNLPLSAMENVQLLKGSTAFMYGFGSPGGIIDYTMKKAPESGQVGSVEAGYRSNNIFYENFDYGTRFGADDRYGIRVNVSNMDGKSYGDTSVNNKSLAVAFDARLTDNLKWSVNALFEDSVLRGQSVYLYPASSYESKWLPSTISNATAMGSPNSFNKNKMFFIDSALNWQVSDNWATTLTAAHSSNHFQLGQEYDYVTDSAGDYEDTTFDGVDLWTFNFFQAMVNGHVETGNLTQDLIFGASYEDEYEKLGLRNFNDQYSTILTGNLFDLVRASWSPRGGNDNFVPYSDTTQQALFASDTLSLGEQWKAIVGFRYTNFDEKTWDTTTHSTATSYRKYPVTPTLALIYKPSSGQTLYASYVQALEAGSSVGSQYANYGTTLPPIESKQYEVGYKWKNNVVDTSIAAFRLERGAEYVDSSTNEYVSNGQSLYQGVDASADWQVTPTFDAGVSAVYLPDAEYKRTSVSWMVNQRVEATSRVSGSLFATYNFASAPGLSAHANVRYTGTTRVYNFSSTELAVSAKAYTLVDANVSYRTTLAGKNVTYRAGINNIFNRNYWVGGEDSFWLGAPREFMLSAKLDLF